MTVAEFNALDNFGKEEMVEYAGFFYANYDKGQQMCDVYQLHGFFVKFCYDLTNHDKLKIVGFEKMDDSQPISSF